MALTLASSGQGGVFTVRAGSFGGRLQASVSPTVPPIDADAQAFFSRVTAAGGALSATEQTAVNTLTVSLKAASIWTKLRVIYPMVGASAAACSQNLKSSLYTGVFSGTWTYASTGVTPGGGANLEVPLNLNTMNSINDISFGYYNRTEDLIGQVGSYGWVNIGTLPYIQFFMKYNDGNRYGYIFDSDNSGGSAGDIRGLNSITRINATQKTMQLNSTLSTFNANSSGTLYSVNFSFVRGSQGGEFQRENAFGFVGDGLTSTNLSDLYTTVQAFQTSLSRQV
jgi:hypothetical protein